MGLKADNGTLVKLFVGTLAKNLIYDLPGANPKHMDIDTQNNAVYWINNNGTHFVLLCTLFDGKTSELYAYSGLKSTMEIAVGESGYLYILDTVSNQIDRFNKMTGSPVSSIPVDPASEQLTIFQGKYDYRIK